MNEPPKLSQNDALIVVDVQNDFCPGGALAVPDGDEVVPVLNEWIQRAQSGGATVATSQDWHPPGHVSFEEQGGEWPPHCVQETEGAELHPDLRLPEDTLRIKKGDSKDFDQYSAFDRTGLGDELRRRGVERVWIGGLAQDVCVRASALDALEEGFEVHVIAEATLPIDEDKGRAAFAEIAGRGGRVESS